MAGDSAPRPVASPAWRLEAHDLRAGLAFATFRGELWANHRLEDWPSLFLSPPDFSPEPIHNLAAALAATRGSLEMGLFLDTGREAAFRTLEDVAEFVRRAYVSSGSGDGSDAPGGGPSPRSPDGPIRPGPDDDEGVNADRQRERPDSEGDGRILRCLEEFAESVSRASGASEFDESFAPAWSLLAGIDPVDSLATGVAEILREYLRRFPGVGSRDLLRWLEDVRLFAGCASALDLWRVVLPAHRRELVGYIRRIARSGRGWDAWNEYDAEDTLLILLFTDVLPDDAPFLGRRRMLRLLDVATAPFPFDLRHTVDPIDALDHMPLPDFALGTMPSDMKERASVAHLLATFVATPLTVLGSRSPEVLRTVDVVLFAAACVCSTSAARAAGFDIGMGDFGAPASRLRRERIRKASELALAWLVEQLPRRGFGVAIESRIEAARTLRYRQADAAARGAA